MHVLLSQQSIIDFILFFIIDDIYWMWYQLLYINHFTIHKFHENFHQSICVNIVYILYQQFKVASLGTNY